MLLLLGFKLILFMCIQDFVRVKICPLMRNQGRNCCFLDKNIPKKIHFLFVFFNNICCRSAYGTNLVICSISSVCIIYFCYKLTKTLHVIAVQISYFNKFNDFLFLVKNSEGSRKKCI